MSNQERWIEANRTAIANVPKLGLVFLAFLILGAIGFYLGVGEGIRSLQAYWINFLFFAGIAQGGVILAAIHYVAKGKWGGPLIRIGLTNVAFIPVTVVLFIGIIIVAPKILPWVINSELAAGKEWWLNLDFFLIRNLIALVIMTIFSLVFAYFVIRPEAGVMKEKMGNSLFPGIFTKNWQGEEKEKERARRILRLLTPVMLFVYCIVYSMIGFDLVMSLSPKWFSTLFGAYFFITAIYTGIAVTIILSTFMRKQLKLENELNRDRFHDLGKLLFAFTILSTDFLWSQFLVIWYGDLPELNFFLLERTSYDPWQLLSWLILFCGFVIPFIALLPKITKRVPSLLSIIALISLIGVFLERAVMVLRSLDPGQGTVFPIGIVEILISLGFVGIYGIVMLWAMRRIPLVPEDSYISAAH